MSDTLKKILITLAILIIYVLTLCGFHIYSVHTAAAEEQRLNELSQANAKLEQELLHAEEKLHELSKHHERALELVQSSDLVIQDLKDSVTAAGSTIKEIKEQQQKIRASVLELISEYNELANLLDGDTDG